LKFDSKEGEGQATVQGWMEHEPAIQETEMKQPLARMAGTLKSFQFTGMTPEQGVPVPNPISIKGSGGARS